MKTRFYFFTIFIVSLCVMGCSERLPEEDFQLFPTGGFPRLGDVPERPVLPKKEDLTALEKELRESVVVSEELKKDSFDHLISSDPEL